MSKSEVSITNVRKTQEYNQRMRDAGMRQVRVWVPDGMQNLIIEYASALRAQVLNSWEEQNTDG